MQALYDRFGYVKRGECRYFGDRYPLPFYCYEKLL
jgi:hypothetical protein